MAKPFALALVGVAVLLAATGRLGLGGPREAAAPDHRPSVRAVDAAVPTGAPRWRGVLAALDDRRARAWGHDDPALLRGVYAPRSQPLSLDREMLRAYHERGLRVFGVHLRFGRIRVVSRARGVVTLRVVDRLGPTTAVTPAGRSEALPRDRATRHAIVLRRVGSGWRIATITAV